MDEESASSVPAACPTRTNERDHEVTVAAMIIQAYGEWWDPGLVDWGRRGSGGQGTFLGRLGPSASSIIDAKHSRRRSWSSKQLIDIRDLSEVTSRTSRNSMC
jgi:hypothetical protein